jgi:hypothetical protein
MPQYEAILHAYERRMVHDLGSAVQTVEALSVLPRFTLRHGSTADVEAVCQVVGIRLAQILRDLELLRARHLLEPTDFGSSGSLRLMPPLLARWVARRVLVGIVDKLPVLYMQLSSTGRAGLVRRVAELQQEPALSAFLTRLVSTRGLFADLDAAAAEAETLRALAEALPAPTARALRRVLEAASLDDRQHRLRGGSRREIVRALEALIHRRDTFDDAARGLLCLAEAENEDWANNATGIFRESFHWRHIDIPKDADQRKRGPEAKGGCLGHDSPLHG